MKSNGKKLTDLIALNRRNFIKLIVGGAVGINLTPLPWKFTDDIAIWTQNWPWVPVPPVGAFTRESTVCRLCPGGCGIEVRKVNQRAVKIEGRTDYPVNPGGICPMGAGGLQLLYNKDIRFTGPMKRVGPRGSGQFVGISWDEALAQLAERISGLRGEGRPDALAAVDGNPARSSISLLIRRFLEAVGSPNYTRIPHVEETYDMVNRLMQGTEGPMAYDLENADFILSFGCGLIEGWGAPGRVMNAWGLWHQGEPKKRKTRIVQIDNRASNTASKSDQWLAVLPGTEAALALGLAHVMIKEGLYDQGFVRDFTFGFDDWTSEDGKAHKGFKTMVLEKYSPHVVAGITGLGADAIVSLARDFARSKAPVALCGKGKGDLSGSLYEFMAVHGLNALAGGINRPGGVLVHDSLPLKAWPEVEPDGTAQAGLMKPRLDLAGSEKFPFAQSLIRNFALAVGEAPESPVDTLLVFSANPAHSLPDGGAFRNALKKIPFVVSFSPYRDDTALMADLILPDHTYLEKTEDVVWPTGLQYPFYAMSRPVVEPLYDTRQTGDVLIRLADMIAKPVGAAFPWKRFKDALKARVEGLYESEGGLTRFDGSSPVWAKLSKERDLWADYTSFDDMWKKITSGGFWYRPVHTFRNGEPLFKTATGRFEFCSSAIETALARAAEKGSMKSALQALGVTSREDEALMPHYEPAQSPVVKQQYPLLMLPYSLINLSSGWVPNPHFANKTLFDTQLRKDESFADINPQTAAKYGLRQGDRVFIESSAGRVRARVNIFEGAMPGVVYLPLGLGHEAYDEYQQGKGINPNDIISGGDDPLSGQMVWWDTRVRISKA